MVIVTAKPEDTECLLPFRASASTFFIWRRVARIEPFEKDKVGLNKGL